MITQFLDSQGFIDYLERGIGSDEKANNLLDKLQDTIGRGQNPILVLPSPSEEPEIITISDPGVRISGSGAKYCYDRFPYNIRTKEQEEKRKVVLLAASVALENQGKHTPSSPLSMGKDAKAESLSPRERVAERERMVLDIKVKLQEWIERAPGEHLHLPSPNVFIPTDLSLKDVQDKAKLPVLLRKSSYSRLWYKPDTMVSTPKAYVKIDFICPYTSHSPEVVVLTDIFIQLLMDYLNEYGGNDSMEHVAFANRHGRYVELDVVNEEAYAMEH